MAIVKKLLFWLEKLQKLFFFSGKVPIKKKKPLKQMIIGIYMKKNWVFSKKIKI